MTRLACRMFAIVLVLGAGRSLLGQQIVDPDFDAKVDRPAYTARHPAVLFDEAHKNYHTAGGRYKPFTTLIKNDGYTVTPNTKTFSKETLKGYAVLIIANAQGSTVTKSEEASNPAFTASECDAVREWVEAGGALLLIAKQHPWGPAAQQLAGSLGVEMGLSVTADPANVEAGAMGPLVFSRDKDLLGAHPILEGRDQSERIDRVLTYTGQSLKGPSGSVALLKLSDTAKDRPAAGSSGRTGSAAGRAQGLAFLLGKGRVVVLGEAGMLSAQLWGPKRFPMGMNAAGTENRQLALNIMHWLSALNALGAGGVAANPAAGLARTAPRPSSAPPAAQVKGEAAKPSRPVERGRPLSTAEIAAQSEQSIALITGEDGSGTGFLVQPGLLITNSHVIDDEFLANVKVRFPSAEKDQQGPYSAALVYEDSRRDLALLTVQSKLPPLGIASTYTFRKGEDIIVIGNPGLSGAQVLENAISRGVMSTKTQLEGMQFYQLGIAVNPGNSGGPVFDSTGAVIGVVTRKSSAQEALAFCIPVEDLHVAIKKAATLPRDAIDRGRSKHNLVVVVKDLGVGGALYTLGIAFRRRPQLGPQGKPIAKTKRALQYYTGAVAEYEKQTLPTLKAELTRVQDDPLVSQAQREKVAALAGNLERLKALYALKSATKAANDPLPTLKATHRRLLTELCNTLALDLPEFLFVFNTPQANNNAEDAPTPEVK